MKLFQSKRLLLCVVSSLTLFGCNNEEVTDKAEATQVKQSESFQFGNVEFKANDKWHTINDVVISEDGLEFSVADGNTALINRPKNDLLGEGSHLYSVEEYQDIRLSVDFNVTRDTASGIYFLGRYRLNITDIFGKKKWWQGWMGGIHPRWDEDRTWKNYDGIAASDNASKKPGQWQTLTVDFKAPRFNEYGIKTEYAQFIDVKVNGVTVQSKQIGTGPAAGSIQADDASSGPLILLGDGSPVAFRNLHVETRDFSEVPAVKPVSQENLYPLNAKTGKPKFNLVELGKKTFLNTGCKECHEVNPAAKSVKTGPSLYGVFAKMPKTINVYDASEQHNTQLLADEQYLAQSLRKSTLHIALREEANGDEKRFLPIMPSYNAEIISDNAIAGLLAYLQTLNPESDKGPDYIWLDQPEKPYVLYDDLTAEIVTDKPRIARVNIGDKASGRAYHVGQPNQMNYTFDPRTLAIESVWSGRFLQLKNEKQGRADSPSKVGVKAKVWPSDVLMHLFQPVLSTGKAVDFSFKEPANLTRKLSNEFLNELQDFAALLTQIDAKFSGVNTPYNALPSFNYIVENNHVELLVNIDTNASITATLNVNNQTPLKLSLTHSKLENIQVTLGSINDGVWTIPTGQHNGITFTAKVQGTPAFELVEDENLPAQTNPKQALVWSPVVEKKEKLFLPNGYRLENAIEPNDKFGRKVLFEPLGINFTENGNAYVSTRTSGVWKITEGKWQQFAEGVFDSLGLIVESENTIVVGEKPGLTRFIDADNDGWAETRQVVSDGFRFNANYHEYLHGPVKLEDNGYLYTLNLGHGMPGGYASGGTMASTGGYRGWAMQVDSKGNTSTFAHGLRSPAGVGVNPEGKLYYTENQGDFQGTSKLYHLKENAYYGHPAGLVDLPGKTVKSETIKWQNMAAGRDLPVALLPHALAMNSPGNPVWDTTKGSFGPYQNQMFVGDQSQSNIFRIHTETINGIEQAALLPFMAGTSSGVMRLTFSNDGKSMWLGQTGRGWWAQGGNISSLQRIVWDGETVPQSIYSIEVQPQGYKVNFTHAINNAERASFNKLAVSSWYYNEDNNYGSDRIDIRNETANNISWSADGKSLTFKLANFAVAENRPATQTVRIYEIDLSQTAFAKGLDAFHTKAWYTLNSIPN